MMAVRWLIIVTVIVLVSQEICGQRRGSNRRPKSCRTSRGDNGKCLTPRQCWYDGEDLFDYENICSYSGYSPLYCCPPNERDDFTSTRIADTRCEDFTRTGTTFGVRENDIFSSEITLGVKASTKEFPHMAVLGYGSRDKIEWKCGGSLISDQFVLTAAHCISSILGAVKVVRLGDYDLSTDTDNAQPQQFSVSQSIPHPQFHIDSQYHDIALLKLDSPVKYSRFVRPACLPTSQETEGQKFIATGWGSLEFAGSFSNTLQKVDLNRFPNDQCKKVFGPQRQLKYGMNDTIQLCAGGYEDGKDTCQGDSGGPLQVKTSTRPEMYKIVGITSFGKGCGLEKVPGVYTRVSFYIPWIEEVVWSSS